MRTFFMALMSGLILPLSLFAQDVSLSQIVPQESVVADPQKVDARPDAERPVFGVTFEQGESGLRVQSVFTNGPFYQVSVRSGDVIVKLDDVDVKTRQQVDRFLLDKKPGEFVRVTRVRDGVTEVLAVRLMSREKLLKVSNTDKDNNANISRQYVGETPARQPYHPDVLLEVDQRLQAMQAEIESLRAEIERLRSESLKKTSRPGKDGT